jgi:hypothetical protein
MPALASPPRGTFANAGSKGPAAGILRAELWLCWSHQNVSTKDADLWAAPLAISAARSARGRATILFDSCTQSAYNRRLISES